MTGRTIKSHDPDLDQTILDMSNAVHRLENAEFAIARLRKEEDQRGAPQVIAQANAIRDTIAARAARLNLRPAWALRLIVERHEFLRKKHGRRPSLEQLVAAVEAATDVLRSKAAADDAEAFEAEFLARQSRHIAAAGVAAGEYLRACA